VPLTLENPVTLEKWQQILSAVDSATTFHDHATTFKGSQAVRIPDDLQKILDQFGKEVQNATFAVRHGLVEGAWLDPPSIITSRPYSARPLATTTTSS
jgi:hypothetical protein